MLDWWITQINTRRFRKNRDFLMKTVEKDFKLIAWIGWSLDLLFKNYSYSQMYDYIGNVSNEELQVFIEPLNTKLETETNSGIVLDKLFALKEEGKVVGYLNIENQLNPYPLEEIDARALIYLCSIVFWESEETFDKKHYREILPSTGLWIFPECAKSRKNTVEALPSIIPSEKVRYNFSEEGNGKPEKILNTFELELQLYLFYLGNPLNINEQVREKTDKAGKLALLLQLLDTIFAFDVETATRLEIAKNIFNLTGNDIRKEVKAMNELEAVINNIVDLRYKNLVEENKDSQIEITRLKHKMKEDAVRSQAEIRELKKEIEELKHNK